MKQEFGGEEEMEAQGMEGRGARRDHTLLEQELLDAGEADVGAAELAAGDAGSGRRGPWCDAGDMAARTGRLGAAALARPARLRPPEGAGQALHEASRGGHGVELLGPCVPLGGARLPDLRRDREEARPRAHEAVGAGRRGFGASGSRQGMVEAGLVGGSGGAS